MGKNSDRIRQALVAIIIRQIYALLSVLPFNNSFQNVLLLPCVIPNKDSVK